MPIQGGMRRILSTALLLTLTIVASAAASGSDQEQVKLTPAGQAAARSAILRLADLGPVSGFTGGPVTPGESSTPDCATYHPKQSDLVKNGDAESSFSQKNILIESEATVLASAAMVQTDWQRTVRPELAGCLRALFARSLGASGKVVSVSDLSFPQVATYAHGYRAVLQVVKAGTTSRVVSDFILFGRGRTEITLNVTSPPSTSTAAVEAQLAGTLAARIVA
ncbi:MAG: hypothetical protein ABI317_11205 [Gaiellales bacterium]